MKKNVWIWNHYASNMFNDQAGRHYWFADNLLKRGYSPTIFCASTIHNSTENIAAGAEKFTSATTRGIPFVFVKTPDYAGNGWQRIKNMFSFYWNLFSVAEAYAKTHGKPDVILASSVHPLTLVAGIKMAKKLGVPCICEVRDLWPESLVEWGSLKGNSLLAKVLYQGEKWIYKKADAIIMTMAGGSQYIKDKHWDRQIDLNKVTYICNGIVVEDFDRKCEEHPVVDADLDDPAYKNVVYAGSIRKANDLGMLLNAAKIIQERGKNEIRFLIYGSGDKRESLIERCRNEGIHNVTFKGRVEKKFVPSILKRSYINVMHVMSASILERYGQSPNKFFEYLAAGKCIVQTYSTNFSIYDEYDCGICARSRSLKTSPKRSSLPAAMSSAIGYWGKTPARRPGTLIFHA